MKIPFAPLRRGVRTRHRLLAGLPLCLFLILSSESVPAQGPENVLLIVNVNSSESVTIGEYYRSRRNLPDENVCRLKTSVDSEISRDRFELEILEPLARHLTANALQDQILFLVTTDGIPLKIQGDSSPVGDLASVDSELTLLYRYLLYGDYSRYGRIENPYFLVEMKEGEFRPFLRKDFEIYLVTRLSAATEAGALALVDRGLSQALRGTFLFDLPSQQKSIEGEWLKEAARQLQSSGLSVQLEQSGRLLTGVSEASGYASFGGRDPALSQGVPQFRWHPGALALLFDHDSFQLGVPAPEAKISTSSENPSLAERIVEQGVTGLAGYVADPTVDGFLRPQVLFPAWISGHNLAESFYLATRYLGWRQVVIGDPLALGFGSRQENSRGQSTPHLQTGGIREFTERRKGYLIQKYTTGREAVEALLRAEQLAAVNQNEAALREVEVSLTQDPFIAESHFLKARLKEQEGNFELAFKHYQRALELGKTGTKAYLKLADLALNRLSAPEKAEPYARWLFAQNGFRNPSFAGLWATLLWKLGRQAEAEAIFFRLIQETENPPVWALKAFAEINLEKGELEIAEEFLEKALTGDFDSSPEFLAVSRSEVESLLQGIALQPDQPSVDPEREENSKAAPHAADNSDDSNGLLNRPARILSRVSPEYPVQAQQRGLEGRVVLKLLIDERGQLLKVDPVFGEKELVRAAVRAVEKWRFAPRLVNGRPQVSRLTVAIGFQIEKNR